MKNGIGVIGSAFLIAGLAGCGGANGSSPNTHPVGGSITGLTASGLVLQNNGGDDLPVDANATSFTFATALANGAGYAVTVLTQPVGLFCTVNNGTGTMGAENVTSVSVACSPVYSVGGSVTGLTASGLVLQNNGGDDLTVNANATTFAFATDLASGIGFTVTVLAQPEGNFCTINNGTGTIGSNNVTDVGATCFPSGSLDTSFNATGYVTQGSTAGGNDDEAYAVAVDSLGRIVVEGYSTDAIGNSNMAVWRYTSAGSLDTTFNSSGYVTKAGTAGGNGDQGFAVAVDGLDRIVVAGYSADASGNLNMAVWRYTSAGSLDTTFNGSGYVTQVGTTGGNDDEGFAVAVDGLDRIVVAGGSYDASGHWEMAAWRYTSTGSLDTTFNSTGHVAQAGTAGGNDDEGCAVSLDDQGRIVVAGYSSDGSGHPHMAVWRYTSTGSLDTTFNTTGYVTQAGTAGGNDDEAYAVAVDSLGRIVVEGLSKDASGHWEMAVWRYTSTGGLDTTFNGTGYVTQVGTAGGNDDEGYSVAVDSLGRVVVAGLSKDIGGFDNMAVWRYTNAGSLDTTFNGTGYVVHLGAAGGNIDGANALALDGQGQIVVAGRSQDASSHWEMAVWRYNP